MLTEQFPSERIAELLVSRAAWQPWPTASDRTPWQQLPAATRQQCIDAGQAHLSFDWPPLPATMWLDYARTGNRVRFQNLTFKRRSVLVSLVMAECVEGQGRFLDAIIDGIWAICEETWWGVPAHLNAQAVGIGLPDVEEPTVDLFVAETSSHLAWAVYLLGDQLDAVSPLLRKRVIHEQRRRLLDPCLQRDDFHWMGLRAGARHKTRRVNNWNPWICSNWLTTAMLLEEDEQLRVAHVSKVLRCLDRFIDPYPKDGGCDEGPSYWGRAAASMYDCLDLLHAGTEGAIDVFDEPLIADMGRFLHRVHLSGDYYVNFADAPAVVHPDAALVFRYGQAVGDVDMIAMGVWLTAHDQPPGRGAGNDSSGRVLRRLFSAAERLQAASQLADCHQAPLPRDVWLPDIEVMIARDAPGQAAGFHVAAKGGHNDESHNHNDIGHFVLFVDGLPVIIDAGVETYTKKTFGPQRYDIWTMQSAWHNLPTIGGQQQCAGAAYGARSVQHMTDDDGAELQLDIAGAYPDGVLTRWQRTIRLQRGRHLLVTDNYELGPQAQGALELSLITACDVKETGPGQVRLLARALGRTDSGGAQLAWDIPGAGLTVESLDLTDARMQGLWGNNLHRLRFTIETPTPTGDWQLRFERDDT